LREAYGQALEFSVRQCLQTVEHGGLCRPGCFSQGALAFRSEPDIDLPEVRFRTPALDKASPLEPVHNPDNRCRVQVNAAGEFRDADVGKLGKGFHGQKLGTRDPRLLADLLGAGLQELDEVSEVVVDLSDEVLVRFHKVSFSGMQNHKIRIQIITEIVNPPRGVLSGALHKKANSV
jgi:hypothetical protein